MVAPPDVSIKIRFGLRSDLQDLAEVEMECFADHYSPLGLERLMRKHDVMCYVAALTNDRGETMDVIGYICVELHEEYYSVLRIAVRPAYQRCGVGRSLMMKWLMKLTGVRPLLTAMTSEWNTESHLFFQACGLQATAVYRDYWGEGDDAYLMSYDITEVLEEA